ncbi:hypothetical protein E1A91_A10G052900v1 [Gossypium mustelinum]|uniref:Ubiquitin receptor RAD23 n=1 Tax=Gossypium mustelinum TaxID=34275 RepID=A0A5D2XHT5_GOSMU|nr:hypothetical protein E1A91_A10G052900v1 [Gossypium mustelinum]
MKLIIKTLKGSHFEIRVQPNDTVMAVKKNIEDIQGKDNYPCGQQLLIHNGKVLKDETTLAENKVSEDGFLVVMLSKSKSLGSTGASSAQPASSTPSTTVPASAPSSNSTPATGAPAQASQQTDTYSQAASNLVAGNNLEQTIQQLMDMGGGNWDKETVTRALRAAYKNPERAVDYLYSETLSGAAAGGDGSLDFLRNNQQFQALRSMVQSNPQILQPMLQELGKQNPQLLRLIQEHHAEFLQLINEPLEGSEGDIFDQAEQEMPHAVNVTPAEQEAIERLEAMGFDRALVIEAFLACDRNEELAANYLLENGGDFED